MRIKQESDYALRVVLYLSRRGMGFKSGAREIAESMKVPLRFALKLLGKLNKQGITCSFRGKEGGYSLARTPEDINLLDVIEAIEGPLSINRCLYEKGACNLNSNEEACTVHNALGGVQAKMAGELKKITFKELI